MCQKTKIFLFKNPLRKRKKKRKKERKKERKHNNGNWWIKKLEYEERNKKPQKYGK